MEAFCVQEGWERRNGLQSKEMGRGGGAGRIPLGMEFRQLREPASVLWAALRGLLQKGALPKQTQTPAWTDVILVASALALAVLGGSRGAHAGLTTPPEPVAPNEGLATKAVPPPHLHASPRQGRVLHRLGGCLQCSGFPSHPLPSLPPIECSLLKNAGWRAVSA